MIFTNRAIHFSETEECIRVIGHYASQHEGNSNMKRTQHVFENAQNARDASTHAFSNLNETETTRTTNSKDKMGFLETII